MQICPSILEYKDTDYLSTIKKLSPHYKYFQIDFADGKYVDNKTATIDSFINQFTTGNFKSSVNLQTLKTLVFDFHLMVKEYEEYIKKIEILKDFLNIKNIFIHFDLSPNLSLLSKKYIYPIGLVLNPQDQIDDLARKYNLKNVPFIQIMSIVPGAQGKPFIPETINKVEQLRQLGYRSNIFLDGAVNDKTLPIINSYKFKPDFICPGSFLAKSPDNDLSNRVKYLLEFN